MYAEEGVTRGGLNLEYQINVADVEFRFDIRMVLQVQ